MSAAGRPLANKNNKASILKSAQGEFRYTADTLAEFLGWKSYKVEAASSPGTRPGVAAEKLTSAGAEVNFRAL